MARVTRTFAHDVLWPEFQQLTATLRAHLESVTTRVITQAIHGTRQTPKSALAKSQRRAPRKGFSGGS